MTTKSYQLSCKILMEAVDIFQTSECADLKSRILRGDDFEINHINEKLQFVKLPVLNSPYMFKFSDLEEENSSVNVYLVKNKLAFVAINKHTLDIIDCAVAPIDNVYFLIMHLHAIGVETSILNEFLRSMIMQDKRHFIYRFPDILELQLGKIMPIDVPLCRRFINEKGELINEKGELVKDKDFESNRVD